MGIVDSFLIKSARNSNIRGVRLALSLHNIVNSFEKLFSRINPFRNKGSFDLNNDQTLNRALEYAVTNLDHNVMTLLISAGANINEINNSIGNVILQYKIASEAMQYGDKDSLKDRKEKCCLVLGELIKKERKEILEILKQTESCDKLKEEVELKFKANSPKKPPRIFEHDDILLLKEPIYDEVYDAKVSNSLEELSVSEESIYAEVYDLHKRSTENLSLKDSGCSSISGEPIYEDVDDFSEQKKPTSLNHKEQPEPIYAKVDLSKKRSERQAKHIKDNSGTYHGLVQDKVNNLQVKLNEQSANKPASQQIKTKAGFNVKEIRQNFERRDSGYDSGYDSDTKVEQKLELGSKAPKSEIGSVSIEHGVIGGCRYKITDISL